MKLINSSLTAEVEKTLSIACFSEIQVKLSSRQTINDFSFVLFLESSLCEIIYMYFLYFLWMLYDLENSLKEHICLLLLFKNMRTFLP